MRIQNGKPKYLQINAHTMGALYQYDEESETFFFVSGEQLEISDGVAVDVEYPETVYTIEGHPELFVSNGSHGNWAAPGTSFKIIPIYSKKINGKVVSTDIHRWA